MMKIKRVFLGIPLSEEIKDKLHPVLISLKDTNLDLKFVALDNIHLTIAFLGNVDHAQLDKIVADYIELLKEYKPFTIVAEGIGAFPSLSKIQVMWVGIKSQELRDLIQESESLYNLEQKEIIPHITIARYKSAKGKSILRKEIERNKDLSFGTQLVDKIILYESTLTPEGPIYKILKEFIL
ncbi:RNA 2',3'-cyclic phosphodiesterase [Candidatus Woesearchaeota archaeon CG10_big_fil_rev_8_21_14_0_10_32_24]|nr:MAG: RNA 2',3'-cyclic phosphodiesterase [Candidatus Woesearchaeota archaeon CG10_big_fil_rev_8_21_14_0_10_32_24]